MACHNAGCKEVLSDQRKLQQWEAWTEDQLLGSKQAKQQSRTQRPSYSGARPPPHSQQSRSGKSAHAGAHQPPTQPAEDHGRAQKDYPCISVFVPLVTTALNSTPRCADHLGCHVSYENKDGV
eukprot:4694246-Amphidinium_carterae.1